jgi:predicted nucleic-acid-binding Zn-ribbon protein
MDEARRKQFQTWMEKYWRHGPCPVCQMNVYDTGEVVELRFHIKGGSRRRTVYPVIPIACRNCGYTLLINAILAGVVRPDPDGDPDDAMPNPAHRTEP